MARIRTILFTLGMAVMLTACLESPEGTLRVGSQAPSIRTLTLPDVGGDFSRITTYRYPDERMYQYSLDDALKENKVILLEFATPGHCTVCDKQLQMLKALLQQYENEVIFIHMDQYQNPGAFIAYRVKGDPWTFVIDSKGIVQFKRPGRMLYNEMEPVLKRVLNQDVG